MGKKISTGDNANSFIEIIQEPQESKHETTWLLFIHGGAWRDSKVDYTDGHDLLEYANKQFQKEEIATASVNYVLSDQAQHPAALLDCINGINALISEYKARKVIVIGHSAGGFIGLQLWRLWLAGEEFKTMDFSFEAIVCVGAIVDLRFSLQKTPENYDFIAQEFLPKQIADQPFTSPQVDKSLMNLSPLTTDDVRILKFPAHLIASRNPPDTASNSRLFPEESKKCHMIGLFSAKDELIPMETAEFFKNTLEELKSNGQVSYTDVKNITASVGHYDLPRCPELKQCIVDLITKHIGN